MPRRVPLRTRAAEADILAGRVRVDGAVVTNPASQVTAGSAVTVEADRDLRGAVKLRAALGAFSPAVVGRVALDAGASTGGFTSVLLEAGAARVYAVEVGHGQLLGSLRQDPRVVNLESTNLADLTPALVPEPAELVTLDLSYLSLAAGVRELSRIVIAPGADLIALVKPMFELRLATAPTSAETDLLDQALAAATDGITAAGWELLATMPSPVPGANGAAELWIHARWPA